MEDWVEVYGVAYRGPLPLSKLKSNPGTSWPLASHDKGI